MGRPVRILAKVLYIGDIWTSTCLAHVHHISNPHIIAGIAVEIAKWSSVPGVMPFRFAMLRSSPLHLFPAADAAAAFTLKLTFLSIQTPNDLISSLGTMELSYWDVPFVSGPNFVQLVAGMSCMSSDFCGENRMFRWAARLLRWSCLACSMLAENVCNSGRWSISSSSTDKAGCYLVAVLGVFRAAE